MVIDYHRIITAKWPVTFKKNMLNSVPATLTRLRRLSTIHSILLVPIHFPLQIMWVGQKKGMPPTVTLNSHSWIIIFLKYTWTILCETSKPSIMSSEIGEFFWASKNTVPAKIFPHETCQHIPQQINMNQPSTPPTKHHLLRTTWTIWLVVEPTTPLKNDGLRQLGWWHSIPKIWKVIIQPCSSHHQPAMIHDESTRSLCWALGRHFFAWLVARPADFKTCRVMTS